MEEMAAEMAEGSGTFGETAYCNIAKLMKFIQQQGEISC